MIKPESTGPAEDETALLEQSREQSREKLKGMSFQELFAAHDEAVQAEILARNEFERRFEAHLQTLGITGVSAHFDNLGWWPTQSYDYAEHPNNWTSAPVYPQFRIEALRPEDCLDHYADLKKAQAILAAHPDFKIETRSWSSSSCFHIAFLKPAGVLIDSDPNLPLTKNPAADIGKISEDTAIALDGLPEDL